MIDTHVHLRDGKQANKETIEHGISIGSLGGILTFFDMPNTDPPLTTTFAIRERIRYGQNIATGIAKNIFYGVYGGLTDNQLQITELVGLKALEPALIGFKMFAGHSTGNMGLVEEEGQYLVYKTLASLDYKGVIAVHCEKESLLKPQLWDPANPSSHSLARPPEAEIVSIRDQIEFVKDSEFKGKLHICHISTEEGVELVNQAKSDGMNITCGVTAHHALLDERYYGDNNLLKMNPPLRSEKERSAIFKLLLNGGIDWIESDHAPHTLKDKSEGASGIPGFAGTLILIEELRKAGIRESQLTWLCGKKANEVFGIRRPVIVPSNDEIEQYLPIIRKAYPWDPFTAFPLES
jgi:dihydroorotase